MFLPLEDARGRSLETFGRNRNMPRWEYLSGLTKVIDRLCSSSAPFIIVIADSKLVYSTLALDWLKLSL